MLFAGVEEHCHDVLRSEDVLSDDKVDKNGDAHETAVETTDGDDDNDEFVEWNEGDGNVICFFSFRICFVNKRWNTGSFYY